MKSTLKDCLKKTPSLLWLIFESLPLTLPITLASFGVVALIFLNSNNFSTLWICLLGGVLAVLMSTIAIFFYSRTGRPGSSREKRIVDALVIIVALFWVAFNINFSSAHVFTDRDPATYLVAGAHLVEHNSLQFPMDEAFTGLDNVTRSSAGFAPTPEDKSHVYAQGQHLLPAFIGLGGRVLGDSAIFNINIIIGAIALLAVYGFARHFIRPRWAMLAPSVLSVALPMIYASRDTYSEPLMMVFAFGTLTAIWIAMSNPKALMWLVAGFVGGASTLVRIDSYLILAAFTVAILVWGVSVSRRQQWHAMKMAGVFLVSIALVAVVGLIDFIYLSPQYYVSHQPVFFRQLRYIAIVLAVVGCAAVTILLYPKMQQLFKRLTKKWRGGVVAVMVLCGVLLLASRPFWMQGSTDDLNQIVGELQLQHGDRIAPRNYAEITTQWLSWYLGPLIAGLGVAGLALASGLAVSLRRFTPLLPFAIAVLGAGLVYSLQPGITPDHPWAARRFLPVVIPGLAVAAAFFIDFISRRYLDKERIAFKGAISVAISLMLIMAPLMVSWPFLEKRNTARIDQIQQICRNLPDNAAMLWVGHARLELIMPTEIFCNVPTVAIGVHQQSLEASVDILKPIAQTLRERGYEPIIGGFSADMELIASRTSDDFGLLQHRYTRYERTLDRPPSKTETVESILIMGKVLKNGEVEPIKKIE